MSSTMATLSNTLGGDGNNVTTVAPGSSNMYINRTTSVVQTEKIDFKILYNLINVKHSVLVELRQVWKDKPKKQLNKVLYDMEFYYNKTSFHQENDKLYKKVLKGLWITIKNSPDKYYLIECLWKQAFDSLEQDDNTHLAKLCNVIKPN